MNLDAIKLVSWDVDGTLYSIRGMAWRLRVQFLREAARGRGVEARREWRALNTYRAEIDAARLTGGVLSQNLLNDERRKKIMALERHWYGPAIQNTGPRRGVVELLSLLAAKGFPQLVISDYESDYKLAALGLENVFASCYVGERLGFVKPSPVLFQRALADYRMEPLNLLHIGDRVDRDETAALAAGCQCLILGRDFADFYELLEEVKRYELFSGS